MRRYRVWVGTMGLAVLAMATVGCDDTARGVKKDAEENAEAAKPYVDAAAAKAKETLEDAAAAAKPAAERAGEELKELGDKAVEGAKDLGDNAEDAADTAEDKTADAGDTVSAAAQTTMVKAALMADGEVDASRIDVDTEAATRTVMLKGTVPTAAQVTAAERIAKSKVSTGYSVRNLLRVYKEPKG